MMKKSHYVLLAILLVAFFLLRRSTSRSHVIPSRAAPASEQATTATNTTAPENFDYYLLNLSWSPEFCHSHPNAVQCSEHATFVLHGLWPQNTNGGYPENCSNAPGPTDPAQYTDIYPDQGLLEHEWKTHGTCSGLAPDAFFQLARQAVHSVKIPDRLASINQQLSLPPDDIRSLFTQANPSIPAASLAISCGNNYLTAVEVCFNKSLQPIDCGPIRTCRANTVRIPPPQ